MKGFTATGIHKAGVFRTLMDCWVSGKGKQQKQVFDSNWVGPTMSLLFSFYTSEGSPFPWTVLCSNGWGQTQNCITVSGLQSITGKWDTLRASWWEILEGVEEYYSHVARSVDMRSTGKCVHNQAVCTPSMFSRTTLYMSLALHLQQHIIILCVIFFPLILLLAF